LNRYAAQATTASANRALVRWRSISRLRLASELGEDGPGEADDEGDYHAAAEL
jgi:hypothetical protein